MANDSVHVAVQTATTLLGSLLNGASPDQALLSATGRKLLQLLVVILFPLSLPTLMLSHALSTGSGAVSLAS